MLSEIIIISCQSLKNCRLGRLWQRPTCVHPRLVSKLPPCFVLWVHSFLTDRKAKVQVGGSHSLSFCIRRRVPQGSALGPVLFILFVDDITKDLPQGAHASLYADDLAIWSSSPDLLKASSVVQSSLNVLETWSNLWRLLLNPKKCASSKKPFRRSFCFSATQSLPSPCETLNMCPSFPPWAATHFTVSPFILDCTGNSTARLQSASSRLFSPF